MKVKVKFFSTLVKAEICDYKGATDHDFPDGATVKDVIAALSLPVEKIKIVFVNNKELSAETVLKEGDQIAFSPVTGGM